MKEDFLIYALIGISKTGKTHLTKYAIAICQNILSKLVMIATKMKRKLEKHGTDKYFFINEQFEVDLVLLRSMYGSHFV